MASVQDIREAGRFFFSGMSLTNRTYFGVPLDNDNSCCETADFEGFEREKTKQAGRAFYEGMSLKGRTFRGFLLDEPE